ncbi:hypothetical protein EV421DRAFT_1739658 [Armillaria borealis]|uniref:Uncharacterized protein n=1 Tax=Armillaria borealis TaxID=47425 RepID=A0AA39J5E5_9AGAR|nr:hypothetical protein EV421DRAFT_1739658 [Armillaria borealis]
MPVDLEIVTNSHVAVAAIGDMDRMSIRYQSLFQNLHKTIATVMMGDQTRPTGETQSLLAMVMQAALPPGLTDNLYLNTTILQALAHGLYTGVLGITLWIIFQSSTKNSSIGRYVMVLTILVLYVLATIQLGLDGFSPMMIHQQLVIGIIACIGTVIADSSLGHQWLVVIIPVLCIILGTVFKGIQIYHSCSDTVENLGDSSYMSFAAKWKMLYLALTLTTTLWCNIFILYRIISVTRSGHGVKIRSYHGVIEALVESAALYSTVSIINIVFVARDTLSGGYADILGATIRGIAPTLLVGCVAAGHARPDDSWQESSTSRVSSLNFGTGSLSTQEGDIT